MMKTFIVIYFFFSALAFARVPYYQIGPHATPGLASYSDAQVIFVADAHSDGDEESDFHKALSDFFKFSNKQRLKELLQVNKSKHYQEQAILVEGLSSSEYVLDEAGVHPNFALNFQFPIKEFIFAEASKVRDFFHGFENIYCRLHIETHIRSLPPKFAEYSELSLILRESVLPFFEIQIRNFYLVKSIDKILEKSPNTQIIVFGGWDHFQDDPLLFGELDKRKISHVTLNGEAGDFLNEMREAEKTPTNSVEENSKPHAKEFLAQVYSEFFVAPVKDYQTRGLFNDIPEFLDFANSIDELTETLKSYHLL